MVRTAKLTVGWRMGPGAVAGAHQRVRTDEQEVAVARKDDTVADEVAAAVDQPAVQRRQQRRALDRFVPIHTISERVLFGISRRVLMKRYLSFIGNDPSLYFFHFFWLTPLPIGFHPQYSCIRYVMCSLRYTKCTPRILQSLLRHAHSRRWKKQTNKETNKKMAPSQVGGGGDQFMSCWQRAVVGPISR